GALAEQGQRVLLLDLDPQAHASLHLGIVPEDEPTMYEVLLGDATLPEALQVGRHRVQVAPAHLDLAAAEVELAGEVGREFILRDRLKALEDQLDYLLIDCPPSLGILTLNALAAVSEVFLPLQPHFLALHGLSKLLGTMELVASRLNPELFLSGVVLCMYDSGTRLAAEVSRDVVRYFAEDTATASTEIFNTRIRRNIRLAEAPSFGQTIFEYAPNSHGAEDYRALAEEVSLMGVMQSPAPLRAAS
ncbi:MAG: ParA family protein, partial [Planctomycetota bacterium]